MTVFHVDTLRLQSDSASIRPLTQTPISLQESGVRLGEPRLGVFRGARLLPAAAHRGPEDHVRRYPGWVELVVIAVLIAEEIRCPVTGNRLRLGCLWVRCHRVHCFGCKIRR